MPAPWGIFGGVGPPGPPGPPGTGGGSAGTFDGAGAFTDEGAFDYPPAGGIQGPRGLTGPMGPPGPSDDQTSADDSAYDYPPNFSSVSPIAPQQIAAASNRGASLFYDGQWKRMGRVTSATNLPDANANLDVDNASLQIMPAGTLTANRIETAPAPAAARKAGFIFSVIRFDISANTLQYKDGPSGNVMFPNGADTEPAAPYQVDFFWDGVNWTVGGYSPVAVQNV